VGSDVPVIDVTVVLSRRLDELSLGNFTMHLGADGHLTGFERVAREF
jgi:hypothetical protein